MDSSEVAWRPYRTSSSGVISSWTEVVPVTTFIEITLLLPLPELDTPPPGSESRIAMASESARGIAAPIAWTLSVVTLQAR